MKSLFLSVFAGLSLLSVIGCSSALRNVELDNSLDKVEAKRGEKNQDGNFDARQEKLAEAGIRERNVTVDSSKGYKVLIVNCSEDPVTITIERKSCLISPVTAQFDFYGPGRKDHYLMPGEYEVTCTLGGILLWQETDEVTTAPQWDDQDKEYYHLIVRNIWVPGYRIRRACSAYPGGYQVYLDHHHRYPLFRVQRPFFYVH
jgi:hypothetical protein